LLRVKSAGLSKRGNCAGEDSDISTGKESVKGLYFIGAFRKTWVEKKRY